MIVVGIDENGLGPILGPMVVTAAAFEVESYAGPGMWNDLADGVVAADSKDVYSKAKLAPAERATLEWLAAFGHRPTLYRQLSETITLPPPVPLPCRWPVHVCDPAEIALPVWGEPKIEEGDEAPALLGSAVPHSIASYSLCPGVFNAATADGINKFQLDFNLMMQLVAQLTRSTGQEVVAICGKIGSTKKYEPWFSALGYPLVSALEESAAISTYRVSGLGTISFVRDADSAHLPVAVASMVGKYLRELAMYQVNLLLGDSAPKTASGYRDPVTKEFIRATEAKRRTLKLPDSCFLRNS